MADEQRRYAVVVCKKCGAPLGVAEGDILHAGQCKIVEGRIVCPVCGQARRWCAAPKP